MSSHPPLVRRTFRITFDIETTLDAQTPDCATHPQEGARYQQALVQSLHAHPAILRQLLRSWAVDALKPASKLLEAEYGWGRASEQQLLHMVMAELEPAAQAYFTEELEEGASAYYVEGTEATIKRFSMIELNEEMEHASI